MKYYGRCWIYDGALTDKGYGRYGRPGRRVHRIVWEILVGPCPDGLEPDHLCKNRACYNPAHLEWVTHAENVRRGSAPTAINARKTRCKRGHLFDYIDSQGKRQCRTCDRERRWNRRNRTAA